MSSLAVIPSAAASRFNTLNEGSAFSFSTLETYV
jgi:hypothetical protein